MSNGDYGYNEFLWPDRYADCVPMDKALELLKK